MTSTKTMYIAYTSVGLVAFESGNFSYVTTPEVSRGFSAIAKLVAVSLVHIFGLLLTL